jgi:SAM-dependent methyltransferase
VVPKMRAAARRIYQWMQLYRRRKYQDLYLPYFRSNESLADDERYIQSAVDLVDSLLRYTDLTPDTRLLDFGCGQGRFANALILAVPDFGYYCGIDTDIISIKWCQRWIQKYHPNFNFIHTDAYHPRYNPVAKSRPEIPLQGSSFDIAFAHSVFSHMLEDDVQFYLKELHQILKTNGLVYLTAFIEENVPDVEENPPGYLDKVSVGLLHRVRYAKSYFLNLVERCGFDLEDFQHQAIERTKQSILVAHKSTR